MVAEAPWAPRLDPSPLGEMAAILAREELAARIFPEVIQGAEAVVVVVAAAGVRGEARAVPRAQEAGVVWVVVEVEAAPENWRAVGAVVSVVAAAADFSSLQIMADRLRAL